MVQVPGPLPLRWETWKNRVVVALFGPRLAICGHLSDPEDEDGFLWNAFKVNKSQGKKKKKTPQLSFQHFSRNHPLKFQCEESDVS